MATSSRDALASRQVPAGQLLICGRCLLLKGLVPGRTDGARQLCSCTPLEVRRTQPRWAVTITPTLSFAAAAVWCSFAADHAGACGSAGNARS